MSEFKVGDEVITDDEFYDADGSIYQEVHKINDVLTIIEIRKDSVVLSGSVLADISHIRHATPEEIAAGHRIDKPSNSGELETLDKLENHISPNCKVEDV